MGKAWLILLIDFNKAFDSIDHKFLENTLKILGFGENMINWIKTFFCSREAFVMVNGHQSTTFQLQQGVPQGDVVSPYIFLLMVEILLIKITKTKNITGVNYAKFTPVMFFVFVIFISKISTISRKMS